MLYGENVVTVYREADLDSFLGAWSIWKQFPNGTYVSRLETLLPSQIQGKDLYVVGNNAPLQTLIELTNHCRSVTVFAFENSLALELQVLARPIPRNFRVVFDELRSLVSLCWDYFFPDTQRPILLEYVEDKVLWRYTYPNTRAIFAALTTYPFNFETWDDLLHYGDPQQLTHEGEYILRRVSRDIEQAILQSRRRVNIAGFNVPLVNVTPNIASDTCIQLAKGEPFAACYWDTMEGRVFDIVTATNEVDVSQLAWHFGGHGNHREGRFQVPRTHPLAAV